ncbi:MAG: hypothetical protein GKR94_16555 [Gammaproteobacteria bacterium]|nr:hypothetical protein [Gammaproteobacteria bacterium]
MADRFRQLGVDARPADELTMLRGPSEEGLDRFLMRQARRLLERDGADLRLRPDGLRPGEEILRWRWVSLALPPDLLISAADAGRAKRIRLLDDTLRILEPTAHLHVHATAAVPFPDIWLELTRRKNFRTISTCPDGFANTAEWQGWLRRALVCRCVLWYWMRYGRGACQDFLAPRPGVHQALGELIRGRMGPSSILRETQLDEFLILTAGARSQLKRPSQSVGALERELALNRRCLDYIGQHVGSLWSRRVLQLWLQMTRIRVLCYRHLVHSPTGSGLDTFKQHFDRIDEFHTSGAASEARAALEREPGLVVEKLELRKAPGDYSKTRQLARIAQRVNTKQGDPALSWTLHFIRDRPVSLIDQIRSHYITAIRLAAYIQYDPLLLQAIRGLDVAGRELQGPLWTLADSLRMLRAASRRAAAHWAGVRPLRLTVHVGEDFRHLLSGLRAVHEPFWWGLMERGDRLGYAFALGLDPTTWCEDHPYVTQPRLERIFDLSWMLDFVSTHMTGGVEARALVAAQDELGRHVQHLGMDVGAVRAVVREIGRPRLWQSIGGARLRLDGLPGQCRKVMGHILRARAAKDELVEVSCRHDAPMLKGIRDALARLLARWRTPIEINPSSNMLIGARAHPVEQPLFHLDPFERGEDRGLVVTLSVDDPVSFATSLADEFAYAWAGLVVGGGESPAYAQEWLERAARAARRAAF